MKRVSLVAVRHPEHAQLFLHGLRTDNGKWALPGGHCKDAETPLEGARREFFEETGLSPRNLKLVWHEELPTTDDPEGVEIYLYESPYDGTHPTPENDPDHEFVTYKWLDPVEHPNMLITKDSNALVHYVYDQLGLAKGVMTRRAPFQPRRDVGDSEAEEVHGWLEYIPGEEAEGDTTEEAMRPYRNYMRSIQSNAKMRALHRLGGKTSVRRNLETGEREFLLHRGMSGQEHRDVHQGDHIQHPGRSSWTPDIKTATGFADQYSEKGSKVRTGVVASAWIPESKVAHVPHMYGKLDPYPIQETDPAAGLSQNAFRYENEVIVDSGHFAVAKPEHLQAPELLDVRHPGRVKAMQDVKRMNLPKPPKIKLQASESWEFRKAMEATIESLHETDAENLRKLLMQESLESIIEYLDKAEAPPRGPGQQHPHIKSLVSQRHPVLGWSWHADQATADRTDADIEQGKEWFLNNKVTSPVHRKILEHTINATLADPNRHFRFGADQLHDIKQNQSLRARHIKKLLSGDKTVRMDLSDPTRVKILALRHSDFPQVTMWRLDGNQGHRKGTNHDLETSSG